jgi:tight adherence protein C
VVLILVIGLLLIGAAAALTMRAFLLPGADAASRIERIRGYGFHAEHALEPSGSGLGSALDDTASRLGRFGAAHLTTFREDDMRARLTAAGIYRVAPLTFLGYRMLSTILLPTLFLWVAVTTGAAPVLVVGGMLLSLLAGWTLPMTFLRRRAEARVEEIERELPELIDLLVLTVEAGIGFGSSLQMATARMTGALGDELRLTLQEQSLGLSIHEALRHMLARCDTPSMRSFVRSMVQGEALGVSIGEILRSLASETRKRRRAAAEEKAQKAPVKLLFPLVFLIFPPIFIVLLYPAIHSFNSTFG